MLIVGFWYFFLPLLIAASALLYLVIFRRLKNRYRIALPIILGILLTAWWLTAGRQLAAEYDRASNSRDIDLILPHGYSGVFAVEFRFQKEVSAPTSPIQIGETGIGVINFPISFRENGGDHRIRVISHDGRLSHRLTGSRSVGDTYFFCVELHDEKYFDCEVAGADLMQAVKESVTTQKKLNDLLMPRR